jgi:hypothetical protein
MYGILASEHLPTQNFVAANVITATARANAWMMAMALNGIQVITDGVTYRRDQIPSCTFAECIRRCPDYPLRRPEGDEIPFLDPGEVPEDDAAFTIWLQERTKWFFANSDEQFAKLVSLPVMAHKETGNTGSTAFDALACDSAGNYVKCTIAGEGYKTHEVAMRGYGPRCRQPILEWILATYSTDSVAGPCPIVDDEILLKLKPALQAARRALQAGCREVCLPLGLPYCRPKAYRAVKLSGFIFRTPAQFKKLTRQEERFTTKTSCGLELLCLRQQYRGNQLSLSDLASQLYDAIHADEHDLTKRYHLSRLSTKQKRIADKRIKEIARRRATAERSLRARISARGLSVEARKTGVYLTVDSAMLAP